MKLKFSVRNEPTVSFGTNVPCIGTDTQHTIKKYQHGDKLKLYL